ncbi:MAG: oligosaccharide flippase family protein [Candidatus Eisenbacteria bacterium]|nr:oligosaccharide flippase family protein [Candidatus Eisenbacteria bacterium]
MGRGSRADRPDRSLVRRGERASGEGRVRSRSRRLMPSWLLRRPGDAGNNEPSKRSSLRGPPLHDRVVRGGFWVLALRVVERLVWLVRMTVLARMLSPEDFGRFGIALLALWLVDYLSRTGFQEALVWEDGHISPYLDTAWTVQALRGVALAAILYAAAPAVAAFFREPSASPLVAAVGINAALLGFTNIGVVRFQKNLRFGLQFAYRMSGTLADLVVSFVAAVMLKNAWALVLGLLSGNFVRLVVSHIVAPRVRFRIDRERMRKLVGFGRWVWGSEVLRYVLTQGDDILVGRVLGTEPLAFYRMGYIYGSAPATEVTHVISGVAFPAYSKLQHEPERLARAFRRTLRLNMFLAAPLSAGIIVLGPVFVRVFLGTPESNQWLPMIVPLQLLTAYGFLRAVGATAGPVFHGVGRPEILTRLTMLHLATLAVVIYPFTTRWGIEGASIAVLLAGCVNVPIVIYAVTRVVGLRVRSYLSELLPPVAAAAAAAGVVHGYLVLVGPEHSVANLAVAALLGSLLYAAAGLFMKAVFGYDVIATLRGRERATRRPGA